jgi:hypothetical protein
VSVVLPLQVMVAVVLLKVAVQPCLLKGAMPMSSSDRSLGEKRDTGTVTSPGKDNVAEPTEVALWLLAKVTVIGVCVVVFMLLLLLLLCNNM